MSTRGLDARGAAACVLKRAARITIGACLGIGVGLGGGVAAVPAWAQLPAPPVTPVPTPPPSARPDEGLTLQILAPAEARTATPRAFVNLLGRTQPGATVQVGGEAVPVYGTGVFVRDRVPLQPGINRIRVEVQLPDGRREAAEVGIERTTPPPPPPPPPADRPWIDEASLLPRAEWRVAAGEPVEVALRGQPGQRVWARLPGQDWQPLAEDGQAPGHYRAWLSFAAGPSSEPAAVEYRMDVATPPRSGAPGRAASRHARPVAGASAAKAGPHARAGKATPPLLRRSPGTVARWPAEAVRLFSVGPDGAELLHGLHEVRLGGPNLAELPAGTLLQVTGQQGGHYRVRLAADTTAWVAARQVQPAPPATRPPTPVFTGIGVAGTTEGDVVNIPFPAPSPWAVRSVSGADGRVWLEVDLFGTHLATTWATQLASARVVREVTLEQPADGRVRLRILPLERRLWGWRAEQNGSGLRITLRAPPAARGGAGSPLAGWVVALEAGHGGANLGAVGATRVPEKDVNRWTTEALKAELEAAGARVVMVREGDDSPTLRERARRVTASGADLFVSVHANASDTTEGYLRAAGASIFYKHAASREAAQAVHRRLLEATGLPDFGLVGQFNYAPTRLVTWMPSLLVEQAFLSNPAEEAQLLDPAFRARVARGVRLGLEDFVAAR